MVLGDGEFIFFYFGTIFRVDNSIWVMVNSFLLNMAQFIIPGNFVGGFMVAVIVYWRFPYSDGGVFTVLGNYKICEQLVLTLGKSF